MDSASSYVISPYVREVPPDVVDCHLSAFRSPRDEASVCAGDHVLVDEMPHRVVLVSGDTWQLLGFNDGQVYGASPLVRASAALLHLERVGLVVLRDAVGKRHAYRTLEIEVNSHCNFRCEFCPVRTAPKPRHVMSLRVYETVLKKAQEYGINQISLNHYSEPTLDPFLVKRVELAAEQGISVELYTNGSGLTPDLLDSILAVARGISVVVNLPSSDARRYATITGTKCFPQVIRNLRYAFTRQVPMTVVVNAPLGHRVAVLKRIQALFGEKHAGDVTLWETDDRAGRLAAPAYGSARCHGDTLGGCILALQDLNVGYDGRVFLCAQDYDEDYVLGDLMRQSIAEIAEGEKASSLRQAIFGVRPAPPDLLCRWCAWTVSHSQKTRLFAIGNEDKLRWDAKRLSSLLAEWQVVRLDTIPQMQMHGLRRLSDR